jgi:hypothetical protein
MSLLKLKSDLIFKNVVLKIEKIFIIEKLIIFVFLMSQKNKDFNVVFCLYLKKRPI